MSAEQQKRMEDTATELVRHILLERFPSTVAEMEDAARVIGARWVNHTLAAIGAEREACAKLADEEDDVPCARVAEAIRSRSQ